MPPKIQASNNSEVELGETCITLKILKFLSEISHLISCEIRRMHKLGGMGGLFLFLFFLFIRKSQVTFTVRRTMLTGSDMSNISQGRVNSVHESPPLKTL